MMLSHFPNEFSPNGGVQVRQPKSVFSGFHTVQGSINKPYNLEKTRRSDSGKSDSSFSNVKLVLQCYKNAEKELRVG